MSGLAFIIQQKDSVKIAKKDSNKPFLELMKVEDSSGIIIGKKKSAKINNVSNVQAIIQTTQNDLLIAIDSNSSETFVLNLDQIQTIPVRKIELVSTPSNLQKKHVYFDTNPRNYQNTTWPSIVLTCTLMLLGFTKAYGANRIKQIYKSLTSFYSANEIVREERVFFHRVNFILLLIYLFTISLLSYFLFTVFKSEYDLNLLYLVILGFVIGMYLVKFISSYILGSIFSMSQIVPQYIFNVLLYNYLLGVLLIPCIALMYYSNISDAVLLKVIILPVMLLAVIGRFMRIFMIGKSNNFTYLYIILYICTLEILPLVVLGKFFIS